MKLISNVLDLIQDRLAFSQSKTLHFTQENGIGRHGLSGMAIGNITLISKILGSSFGFNLCLALLSFVFPIHRKKKLIVLF